MDVPNAAQFVTWRLADALPYELLQKWTQELGPDCDSEVKKLLYRRIEAYLDHESSSQLLNNPIAAKLIHDALKFGSDGRFFLHAWVVMPNHVHILFTPNEDWHLDRIVKDIKSFTAHEINRSLGRTGRLWQPDYFDRWIRDEEHFEKVLRYIEWNPVKAKLCEDSSLWPWSSKNPEARRFVLGA